MVITPVNSDSAVKLFEELEDRLNQHFRPKAHLINDRKAVLTITEKPENKKYEILNQT